MNYNRRNTTEQTQTTDDQTSGPDYGPVDQRFRRDRARKKMLRGMKMMVLAAVASLALGPLPEALAEIVAITPMAADVAVGLVTIYVWAYAALGILRAFYGTYLAAVPPIHVLAYPLTSRIRERVEGVN